MFSWIKDQLLRRLQHRCTQICGGGGSKMPNIITAGRLVEIKAQGYMSRMKMDDVKDLIATLERTVELLRQWHDGTHFHPCSSCGFLKEFDDAD